MTAIMLFSFIHSKRQRLKRITKWKGVLRLAIISERLVFRPYNDGDFEFLMSLLSDPKVVRYIGNGKTRTL